MTSSPGVNPVTPDPTSTTSPGTPRPWPAGKAAGTRDGRDRAVGLLLVRGKTRIAFGLNTVLLIAFGAAQFGGAHRDRLIVHLDGHVRVGPQVPVPVGVAVRSGLRGEHEIPVAVSQVHHRVDPRLTAAGAGGAEQQ